MATDLSTESVQSRLRALCGEVSSLIAIMAVRSDDPYLTARNMAKVHSESVAFHAERHVRGLTDGIW